MKMKNDHQFPETFSELHTKVAEGKAGGRVLWQPRIGCWYADKLFEHGKLPEPWMGMSLPEIYRELGCSARIYQYSKCFVPVEDPAVEVTTKQVSDTDIETTWTTPVGTQQLIERNTPSSPRKSKVKWSVATEEELKVATWRAEHRTWRWDEELYQQVLAEWGTLGAPIINMPRTNIQDLYINTMGVENAIYALFDWPETVEAYFRAMDDAHDRLITLILESPIRLVTFGDNLHCGTLTLELFSKYLLPAYHRRIERLRKGGCFISSHWDGDTQSLLPLARETRLDAIEAITPEPQGDVTLEEMKEALGDELVLMDGLPAILFDTTYPVSMLEEYTHRLIELFAPKLILGISDELSSTGDIERIRIVGKIVSDYNRQVASS